LLIKASQNEMRINKILSIDEIFELPIITHGTPEQLKEEIKEESENIERKLKKGK
jgi:hypothetical protein